MKAQILYSDSLIELDGEFILLRGYYFPVSGKRIRLSEVESIRVEKPSVWNGKYRLYGSGDLRTWFPPDWKRWMREKIFVMRIRGQWHRIGFTVEDAAVVEGVLRQEGLLAKADGAA